MQVFLQYQQPLTNVWRLTRLFLQIDASPTKDAVLF
jgi:hypothetical protein